MRLPPHSRKYICASNSILSCRVGAKNIQHVLLRVSESELSFGELYNHQDFQVMVKGCVLFGRFNAIEMYRNLVHWFGFELFWGMLDYVDCYVKVVD